MNAIITNPFRILGIHGNSSEREILKQKSKLNAFISAGKDVKLDYDIESFGKVNRNQEIIQDSINKIDQAKYKVFYALFWFVNSTPVDEVALNHVKSNNTDKAIQIWENVIKDHAISEKNYSAISNLATLQLGIITKNGSFNIDKFKDSVNLKFKLIESEFLNSFIKLISGDGCTFNKNIILKDFIDEIIILTKPYLNKDRGISSRQLFESLKTTDQFTEQYVQSYFTDKQISSIERKIEETKNNRINNSKDTFRQGEILFIESKEDIIYLKNTLGSDNIKYAHIANNLANEILQCAIEYFIFFKDDDNHDPGEDSLKIMKLARSVGVSGNTKERIDENIENVTKWINDKPEREKIKNIKNDIDTIGKRVEIVQNSINNINLIIQNVIDRQRNSIDFLKFDVILNDAKNLIVECKKNLDNIEFELGEKDKLFLDISTTTGFIAEQASVMVVNKVNEMLNLFPRGFIPSKILEDVKHLFINALKINYMVDYLKLDPNFKKRHRTNLSTIEQIVRDFGLSTYYIKNEIENFMGRISKQRSKVKTKNRSNDKDITPISKTTDEALTKNLRENKETKKGIRNSGNSLILIWGLLGLIFAIIIEAGSKASDEYIILSAVTGLAGGMVIGYFIKTFLIKDKNNYEKN